MDDAIYEIEKEEYEEESRHTKGKPRANFDFRRLPALAECPWREQIPPGHPSPRRAQEAQQRADQIQAFWEELKLLEEEQVLVLSQDQRRALRSHHDQLFDAFSRRFEVDTTRVQKQLSLGMGIASLRGALAFAAAELGVDTKEKGSISYDPWVADIRLEEEAK